MISFAVRRWTNLAVCAVLSGLGILFYSLSSPSLRHSSFFMVSGWVLFGLLIVLALYTVRKKLPFLPLFSSSQWLQFHVYAGLLSVVLFCLHIDFRVPSGGLEIALTILYLIVVGSGLVGLALSRTIPGRLTTHGEQVLFERIPTLRRQLRDAVEEVLRRAMTEANSVIIAEFYARQLVVFFSGPRHFWRHLVESNRPRYRLLNELVVLDRYVNTEERKLMEEIAGLIRAKDDLDYQYAHQAVLKYWLFVHIPVTSSLMLVGFVHGLVMMIYYYAFRGGTG